MSPSVSVSFQMLGIDQTMTDVVGLFELPLGPADEAVSPGRGNTPIGMFSPSANRVAFVALPSGPIPSSTVNPSRAFSGSAAANGYSMLCETHSRPRASNARFIGF